MRCWTLVGAQPSIVLQLHSSANHSGILAVVCGEFAARAAARPSPAFASLASHAIESLAISNSPRKSFAEVELLHSTFH
jgi:hypothetical protein